MRPINCCRVMKKKSVMQSSHPKPPGGSVKPTQRKMKRSAQTGITGRSVRPASTGSIWGRGGGPWKGPVISAGRLSLGRGIRSCRAGSSVMHVAAGAPCQTLSSGLSWPHASRIDNHCLKAASGKAVLTPLAEAAGTLWPACTVADVMTVYTWCQCSFSQGCKCDEMHSCVTGAFGASQVLGCLGYLLAGSWDFGCKIG